jgi:glutamate dehydrogenase (NADP+)
MSQNSLRLAWTRAEVDARLRGIMRNIHAQCVTHGTRPSGSIDDYQGADLAGFIKLANAMQAYGLM